MRLLYSFDHASSASLTVNRFSFGRDNLSTYLVPRSLWPALPPELSRALGFSRDA